MTSLDNPSGLSLAREAHEAGAVLQLVPAPPTVRVTIEFRAEGGADRANAIAQLAGLELLTVPGVGTVISMVHDQ